MQEHADKTCRGAGVTGTARAYPLGVANGHDIKQVAYGTMKRIHTGSVQPFRGSESSYGCKYIPNCLLGIYENWYFFPVRFEEQHTVLREVGYWSQLIIYIDKACTETA